ncbi:MAG: hypothetical protein A2252_08585 [Elusimicrobia bacterium RIFOXYA2_FULL_39_19]|nr:MAG: hypothetical protein A2252_08585 [Elusimicrobia bacterium RIFOXYA2_FULL_39_19]
MKKNKIIVFGLLIVVCIFMSMNVESKSKRKASKSKKSKEKAKAEIAVIYGDTRTGHDMHRQIVDLIMKTEPGVVFHTGDMVEDGTKEQEWKYFNDITHELRKKVKFYPTVGNHEKSSKLYFDNFELPNNEMWYTVDYSSIHFVVLDTDVRLKEGAEQYTWLENDLQKNNSKYKVLIFHYPPYSTGSHGDELRLQKYLVPLIENSKVDMVFNGHDHQYERSYVNGVYYIVAGGGGAPLRAQKENSPYSQKYIEDYHFCVLSTADDKLDVKVYDLDMNIIDEFSKTK